MKVVILAGGYGTRLSEYTKTIPKPMINISGQANYFSYYEFLCKAGFQKLLYCTWL